MKRKPRIHINAYGERIYREDKIIKIGLHWPDGCPLHVRIGLDRAGERLATRDDEDVRRERKAKAAQKKLTLQEK
jgi:hypothetical protein